MPPYSGFNTAYNPRLKSNYRFNLRDWNDLHSFDQNPSGSLGNSMEGFQTDMSKPSGNNVNFGSIAASVAGPIAGTAKQIYNAYAPDLYTKDVTDNYEKLAYNSIYGKTNEDPLSRAAAIFQSNGDRVSPFTSTVKSLVNDYSDYENTDSLINAYYDNPLHNISNIEHEGLGLDWINFTLPAVGALGLTGFGPLSTSAMALAPLASKSKMGQDFNQSTFQGALAGTQYGGLGWGTLAGATLGSLANIATNIGAKTRTNLANLALNAAQEKDFESFQDAGINSNKRMIRNSQRNKYNDGVMAEGGYLDGLNGVTHFNVGNTHEQNPYDGIQQGIASDGNPNLVEEGEIKYKDYIYSNRLKPSKSLLKQYNLPEKYAGKTFAEIGDKLQKESEERPNDPISKTTLDEWMLRLQNAQEDYKAKAEERRLAKVVNNMSDEEKAALLASLEQPMMQQEGYDLSQPMYAKGGKIHIKPSKRGTFTAAAKKHGKSVQAFASQVLANKENYSPAMVKKANFAKNAAKWKHAEGGHLYPLGGKPWEIGYLYDENIAQPTTDEGVVIDTWGDTPYPLRVQNPTIPESKKTKDKFNASNLRYAPAVGAGLGALTAMFQPIDYRYADELRKLSSQYKGVSAPHLGGYRRYTPYDVNLGDAENLALQAQALAANRGQNRATQAAANVATISRFQEANAKRNLAAQQANEANRLAVDTYNLGINQFNAQRDTQYDQLNQQILNNRLNMLSAAAQAADASRTAWAANINSTTENAFNQLGNVGRDEWNKNQRDFLLRALGREGLLELIKSGYFNS